jgi:uncharacterized protein YceK
MTRAIACGMFALTLALTGCGTARNFSKGWEGRTKPYGGVRIAVDRFRHPGPEADMGTVLLFWTTDVPLSAIGDTLTLPLTLPIAGVHAVHDSLRDYYFPEQKPGANRQPDPKSAEGTP